MNGLLTVAEVAERLRVSPRFVRDELMREKLVGSRFGGEWRIAETAVDVYIEAHLNVRPVKQRRRSA